jgi:hypothetical protein
MTLRRLPGFLRGIGAEQPEDRAPSVDYGVATAVPTPADWLPTGGLPPTRFPRSVEVEWFDMDSAEAYRANGGHPRYGPHDISYRFNALGYRSPEFQHTADIRVVAVGCSYVLGVALPEDALFHHYFAERLCAHSGRRAVVWNLGYAGASNDYITRILQLAVPFLDPNVVLINFTHASRREYVSAQNEVVPYNPGWSPADPVSRRIKRHLLALSSAPDDRLNVFRNYRAVEALLTGRCWLFSTSDLTVLDGVMPHVAPERYVGTLTDTDRARDGLHPGPRSHAELGESYWKRLLELHQRIGTPDSRVW